MQILIILIPKSASSSLAHVLKQLHAEEGVKISKIHLMPTEENLKKYSGQKKIVLLRNPEKCKEAAKRAVESSITPLELEDENGFINYPYKEFYKGWIKNIDGKTKLIHYEELVENPKKVVNNIESFYGLKKSRNVKLPKLNYSRSKLGKHKRKAFIQLRKIKFLRSIRNNYFPEELKRITAI